jgi:hypothetical protein
MLREVLNAMKYNDQRALARWDDVYPHALKDYLAPFEGKAANPTTITGKIASEPAIQATLQNSSDPISPRSGSKANRAKEPSPSPSPCAVNSTTEPKDPDQKSAGGTLPSIIESTQSGPAAYEALQQAGHIRSTSEFVP